jgi:hypothetical protein
VSAYPRAYMRVNGDEQRDLTLVDIKQPGVSCADVPGFGHVLVMHDRTHPSADHAIVTRGPGTEYRREVTRIEDRIEVLMLHKSDRLDVVFDDDCKRFGYMVPGHTLGSNWDWVPCPHHSHLRNPPEPGDVVLVPR